MTIAELHMYHVIGIFGFVAIVMTVTIFSSRFKKIEVDNKTIFKFHRGPHDANLCRASFGFILLVLIAELYIKPQLFTSLFLLAVLYDLYLSIRFAKYEANKRLLYHRDFDLYEYYSKDDLTIFSSKDIRSILVTRPIHLFGKFRIADIELDNKVLRITEHLFDFDKVDFFEGKNVFNNKPSLMVKLGNG